MGLQCDALVEPLGIDSTKPLFSWRLQDPRWGAAKTAYQLQVATKSALLTDDRGGHRRRLDKWNPGASGAADASLATNALADLYPKDITAQLRQGKNLLGVGITHYNPQPGPLTSRSSRSMVFDTRR